MPSNDEIDAARAVLTDDRIAEMRQGFVAPESIIRLMLEAAEKVRAQAISHVTGHVAGR